MNISLFLGPMTRQLENALHRANLKGLKSSDVRDIALASMGLKMDDAGCCEVSATRAAQIANATFDVESAATLCQRYISKRWAVLIPKDDLADALHTRAFHYPLAKPADQVIPLISPSGVIAGMALGSNAWAEHERGVENFVANFARPVEFDDYVYREWDSVNCGGNAARRAFLDLSGDFLRSTRRTVALDAMLNEYGYFPEVLYRHGDPYYQSQTKCYLHGAWRKDRAVIGASGDAAVAQLRQLGRAVLDGTLLCGIGNDDHAHGVYLVLLDAQSFAIEPATPTAQIAATDGRQFEVEFAPVTHGKALNSYVMGL